MSVIEAEKIIDLKNKFGVKLTVVHNWLFSHIMKRTFSLLKGKEVGELLGFTMDIIHTKDDSMSANPSHWSHSMKAGRFGENLPHPIYMTRAILGEVKVIDISNRL